MTPDFYGVFATATQNMANKYTDSIQEKLEKVNRIEYRKSVPFLMPQKGAFFTAQKGNPRPSSLVEGLLVVSEAVGGVFSITSCSGF